MADLFTDPFKVLSSKAIYHGRVIDLSVERVQLEQGPVLEREIIRHPGAVVMLPLLNPETVILIRQYRYAAGQELWELPAGTLEPDETARDCAQRELAEEIGYQAGSLEKVHRFYVAPGYSTEAMDLFVARGLTSVEGVQGDDDEVITVVPMNQAAVHQLMTDGQVLDAKTLVGLLWWQQESANG